jgi:predicted nucleic acid-binding protein
LRRFLDSNVLVYAVSRDSRRDRARETIAQGGTISVQVLNEFANVARRKLGYTWEEIADMIASFERALMPVLPITHATHKVALSMARDHGFSIYDALIVSAALEGGCREVLSEDMQHGRKVEGLTIRNPFRSADA